MSELGALGGEIRESLPTLSLRLAFSAQPKVKGKTNKNV